jgi:type I restriction enzyme S subunit
MTANYPLMSAKHILLPGPSSSGLIKGAAAYEEAEGLVPGYSASGQDVWLDPSDADGRGAGLILSAVGARCGKAFLATAPAWGTVANTVAWKISPQWDPEFTHYVFNREDFWIKGGSAQPYVQVPASLTQKVPKFPLEDQVALRKYLNVETAQIDALMAKQKELIETLAERRKAVITRAVTRGLDPTVELKNSEIAVLDEIPKHWDLVQLKRFLDRIEQGVSPEAGLELADQSSWGVLKAGCVNRGYFSDVEHKRLSGDFEFKPYLAVSIGDLLVNRASGSPSLVGSAAIVRILRYNVILSDKIFRLVVRPEFSSAFLEHVLQSMVYRTQVLQSISGADGLANNLPSSSLKRFWIPRPPLAEQRLIAKWLDVEIRRIDSLIEKATDMIEILRERRQALISAAVTGKIDVRGIA